jgi:serine/threonine protein kinase
VHDTDGDSLMAITAPAIKQDFSFAGWKPGDVIANGLEIVDLIGQGGMGVVWRVHHREWNRELAVKMPLPALVGSPTARDRFLREAETWIDLGVHPHIVQCWFVKDISGLPSLFLDFLTGGSLKQWLTAGHLRPGQWERILEIAIHAAEGLAYAHSRGVVHRDVKPANLLIRGDERCCVTDFGIVKTANDKPDEMVPFSLDQLPKDVSITGTGAFLGTPQYGAPEQWGAAEGVDQAADIYALGVTLYEMCCGRRPFDTDEERTAPEVLIERHLDATPPDPREFYEHVPPEIAHLTLMCLEKDRTKRPHTMERLKGALIAIYERVIGRPYQGVGDVPKEQRADILNNRAVSLYSLAKPHEARDVWRKGLRIESGHPECLYNLTQLELRAGRVDGDEALRRLRQAKAGFPLALMCIEEGHPAEAVETINDLETAEQGVSEGPIHRALGDAQMYCQQYYAAEKAYRSALNVMPADPLSDERKRLANLGRRGLGSKILFPSADSVFHVVIKDSTMKVIINDQSDGVVGISRTAVTYWNVKDQVVEHRVNRSEGATPPIRLRCSGNLMLCEDETAFELRRLPNLSLLGRKSGKILTTTRNLRQLVVHERKGFFIFDVAASNLKQLYFPEGIDGLRLARFDLSEELLCLLLTDGRIAQPDDDGNVNPEEWPPVVPHHENASAMALSRRGTLLYVGHSDGRFQALNFARQAVDYELDFEKAVVGIETTPVSKNFLVHFEDGFAILTSNGAIVMQADGVAVMDQKRGRVLCVHDGRLALYSLHPFRRLRAWNKGAGAGIELSFAADGQRALTTIQGRFDVWEIDEDNRVYEKSFLLSPGKSFAEISSASKRFEQSFLASIEALHTQNFSSSYRHLQRARSIDGFAQRRKALDMNWQLLTLLRRGDLESVWERASLESTSFDYVRPGPIELIGEGERLMTSFGRSFQLYADDGDDTVKVWSKEAGERIVMMAQTDENVMVMDKHGTCWKMDLESGDIVETLELNVGPIKKAFLTKAGIVYKTKEGAVGMYDFKKEKHLGTFKGLCGEEFDVIDFRPRAPILIADTEFFKLDLNTRTPKPVHLRLKDFKVTSAITFAGLNESQDMVFLGFEDGSLVISDTKTNPLFYLQHADGPITGFRFFPRLSVGVASTGNGKLAIWDLHTGDLLEEFTAHRGWIMSLRTSRNGRFLLTTGTDNQVRLWETSYTCTEEEGEPSFAWKGSSIEPVKKFGRLFGFGRK